MEMTMKMRLWILKRVKMINRENGVGCRNINLIDDVMEIMNYLNMGVEKSSITEIPVNECNQIVVVYRVGECINEFFCGIGLDYKLHCEINQIGYYVGEDYDFMDDVLVRDYVANFVNYEQNINVEGTEIMTKKQIEKMVGNYEEMLENVYCCYKNGIEYTTMVDYFSRIDEIYVDFLKCASELFLFDMINEKQRNELHNYGLSILATYENDDHMEKIA